MNIGARKEPNENQSEKIVADTRAIWQRRMAALPQNFSFKSHAMAFHVDLACTLLSALDST